MEESESAYLNGLPIRVVGGVGRLVIDKSQFITLLRVADISIWKLLPATYTKLYCLLSALFKVLL